MKVSSRKTTADTPPYDRIRWATAKALLEMVESNQGKLPMTALVAEAGYDAFVTDDRMRKHEWMRGECIVWASQQDGVWPDHPARVEMARCMGIPGKDADAAARTVLTDGERTKGRRKGQKSKP